MRVVIHKLDFSFFQFETKNIHLMELLSFSTLCFKVPIDFQCLSN